MDSIIEFGWVWLISLGGFLILWPISLVRRDASIVDFWWGPGFGAMAVALWIALDTPLNGAFLALFVPLIVWSVRLGVHLGWRRLNEAEEDPRYQDLRRAWGLGWWWKSLFIVFILQSVLQGLIGLGILAALVAATNVVASTGIYALSGLALVAIAIETTADLELDRFRARHGPHGLLTTGLRTYVRHPNYTAEIAFWAILSMMAMSYGVWWAVLSGLMVAGLLRYVSGVTIIDERMTASRPQYASYRNRVPALLPKRSRPSTGGFSQGSRT